MRAWFFLLLVVFFAGCENSSLVPEEPTGSSPVLQSLSLFPTAFNLEVITPIGGNYALLLSLDAVVSDPEGDADLGEVRFRLISSDGSRTLVSGVLQKTGAGTYSADISFAVTRAQSGIYTLEVQAFDKTGYASTALTRQVVIRKRNTAPVVSLPGVRAVAAQGTDSTRFALTIAAVDSEGLSDIVRVTARGVGTRDSSAVQLFDDGLRSNGDAVAGDGIFSGFTWVTPRGNLQDVLFEFQAQDAAGALSTIARKTVANAAPQFASFAVPAAIQRPASGASLITFAATVADQNGLADIDSVYFRNTSSAVPAIFLMYDDGALAAHGDSTAGDGTYSLIVTIDASTTPGVKQFVFSVVDRSGARADSTKPITIN